MYFFFFFFFYTLKNIVWISEVSYCCQVKGWGENSRCKKNGSFNNKYNNKNYPEGKAGRQAGQGRAQHSREQHSNIYFQHDKHYWHITKQHRTANTGRLSRAGNEGDTGGITEIMK